MLHKITSVEIPITSKRYLLEKYPGKGGWTYIVIPAILDSNNTPFRWLKVKGTIDRFQINNYNLMPIKGGKLFLPVKAEKRLARKLATG